MKNNNSDFIQILKKINSKIIKKNIEDINKNDLEKIIKEKNLFYNKNVDEYISFAFIKQKNNYYPIFFSKIKKKKNRLLLTSKPIFCKVTINLLKTLNVQDIDIHKSDDIQRVFLNIQGLIEKNNLPLSFVNGISFYSPSDLILQDIFDNINQTLSTNQLVVSKENSLDNILFFDELDNVKAYLEENNVAKLIIDDESILNYYPYYYINNTKNENVCLLCNSKEDINLQKTKLLESNPKNMVFSLEELLDSSFHQINENLNIKELKLKKESYEFIQYGERYYSFIETIQSIYRKYHLKDETIRIKEIKEKLLFDIDTSNYKYAELQKDEAFLDILKGLPSILSSYIVNHKFYGLSEKVSKDSYDEIINLITEIKKDFISIKDFINQNNIKLLSEKEITAIKDIEQLISQVDFLSQCPNIPIKEFEINQEQNISNINTLMDLYHNLSARKLIIQTLTSGDFLSLDFNNILHELYSKNIIKKIKVFKMIYNSLVSKKFKRANQLIHIMKQYLDYQKKIDSLLPTFKEKYGDRINTISGIKELETEFKYISNFTKKKEQDEYFDINNNTIRKFLTSSTFKNSYLEKINQLKDLFSNLEKKITNYIYFFIDDKHDFVNPTFDVNIKFLDRKLESTAEDFNDYLTYITNLKNCSDFFKLAINKSIINKNNIINLTKSYMDNVIYIRFQEARNEINKFKQDFIKCSNCYFDMLENSNKYDLIHLKEAMLKEIKIDNQGQSNIYTPYNIQNNISGKKIILACVEDIVGLDDMVFDNLIVPYNISLSNEVILDSVRISKKTLFINSNTSIDPLTQEYFFSNINYNSFLKKIINLNFDTKDFESIKNNLPNGYRLELDKFISLIDLKKKKKYIIIPSSYLVDPIVGSELLNAFSFISKSFNNTPILILDSVNFSFNQEETIKELLQIIS